MSVLKWTLQDLWQFHFHLKMVLETVFPSTKNKLLESHQTEHSVHNNKPA